MILSTTILATLASLASWTKPVAANLRITADHHSFGGVNYPQLQFFTPSHRDETIREIVKSGARVIRLFSMSSKYNSGMKADHFPVRPDKQHPDVRDILRSDRVLMLTFPSPRVS